MTRKCSNGRKKLPGSKGDDEMDPDIENLRKIHALLDVVERDIVPLTCTAVCQQGGNTVRSILTLGAALHIYSVTS